MSGQQGWRVCRLCTWPRQIFLLSQAESRAQQNTSTTSGAPRHLRQTWMTHPQCSRHLCVTLACPHVGQCWPVEAHSVVSVQEPDGWRASEVTFHEVTTSAATCVVQCAARFPSAGPWWLRLEACVAASAYARFSLCKSVRALRLHRAHRCRADHQRCKLAQNLTVRWGSGRSVLRGFA
eukprot:1594257-Amphidinium_carterae.1